MPAYDPDLDHVYIEKQVPGTDLVVQVCSYNGGELKVQTKRVIVKKDDSVMYVEPRRLTLSEHKALTTTYLNVVTEAHELAKAQAQR